jgi:hypothetical protein
MNGRMNIIEMDYKEFYEKIIADFNKQIKRVHDNMKECKTWKELESYRNRYFISFNIENETISQSSKNTS